MNVILLESGSLKDELFKRFGYSLDTPSASSFIQARDKIRPDAFHTLLDEANPTTLNVGDLKGFGATIVTEDATNKLIKIESSDPEVLEVIRTNAGDHYTYTLHALKQGTATLMITSNGNTAQGQPVTKQVEITVNEAVTSKEELEAKIEEANTILENENLYTNTSLDVLKNALKLANDIDQKEEVTQTEVNAQVVQLFKAI